MNLPKGWKEIKLSDIASHRTIKNKDSKYTETYTNSAMQGIVRQTEYFDKEISNKENIADYYLVEENDYVYNPRISAAAPCGPISKSHFKETGIMSPLYTVFRITSKNFTDDYLEQYFKSHFWHSYMKSVANNGARYDRMNITTEDFFNIPVPFPPLPEQEKIARILSAQDKVIALKQKLLQEKQQQKKYLMQKLLGADGASFMLDDVKIDKSGWKKESIKKISKNIFAGATPATKIGKYWGGNISWMSSGEINKKIIYETDEKITLQGYESCSTKLVPERCVLVALAGQGKTRGMVGINEISLCTNQSLATIIPEKVDYKYLYHFLDSKYLDLRKISSGDGTRGGLNLDIISNYVIYLPSLPEQQVIAKVLSAADKEIELLQKSIEQEKQKKKALMQLLLTGIVRVKI